MQNKTISNRLMVGFKKGFLTPTLPENLVKFNSLIYIRIIRFLGGTSFLILLGRSYISCPSQYLYIAMFFAFIFTCYHFYLTYLRIKHMIKVLRSEELDVRNSPLDRLASLGARALFCFKGACDTAQPVGLTLGLMLGTDEVLKSADRAPVFAPFLGGILNAILPEGVHKDSTRLIYKNINELQSNNQEISLNNKLLDSFKDLNINGDLSKEEYTEFQKLLLLKEGRTINH